MSAPRRFWFLMTAVMAMTSAGQTVKAGWPTVLWFGIYIGLTIAICAPKSANRPKDDGR